MFTGIVEELGTVKEISHQKNLSILKLQAKKVLAGTKLGDSILVNGVCLTVTDKKPSILTFEIMRETVVKTTLATLRKNDPVNLERAMSVKSRFHGHFVTGHVDCVGAIKQRVDLKNYTELRIENPRLIRKFIVAQGSICLDGVSLTVGHIGKDEFSVYLIPFTKKITTLGERNRGEELNIEADLLAKYVLNW